MESGNRIYRSRDAYIGGVCAGIADHLDLDRIAVRIVAVLLTIVTVGVAALVYLVLWIAIPLEPAHYLPLEVEPEQVESSTYGSMESAKARGRCCDSVYGTLHNPNAAVGTGHTPPQPPECVRQQRDAADEAGKPGDDSLGEGANAAPFAAHRAMAFDVEASDTGWHRAAVAIAQDRPLPLGARVGVACGLVAFFILVAMGASPLVPTRTMADFWPVAATIAGLVLIVLPINKPMPMVWTAGGIAIVSLGGFLTLMSLGVFSWSTMTLTFGRLWILLVAGAFLYVLGIVRRLSPLVLAGGILVALFCLLGSLFCGIPGDIGMVVVQMPDGNAFKFDPSTGKRVQALFLLQIF